MPQSLEHQIGTLHSTADTLIQEIGKLQGGMRQANPQQLAAVTDLHDKLATCLGGLSETLKAYQPATGAAAPAHAEPADRPGQPDQPGQPGQPDQPATPGAEDLSRTR